MTVESITVVSFKPDLRSAKGSRIQRGLLVRLSRVLSLIFLDILSLTLAWELTVIYSPTSHYSGMKKTSFLILALALQIGTIAIKGLYKSGSYRRNYSSLFQTVSTSQLFLLLITFVYEQSSYIPCSDLIIFWLEGAWAELIAHAVAGHHRPRDLRDLLDVVAGAGAHLAEH